MIDSLTALDRGVLLGATLLAVGVVLTGVAQQRRVPAMLLFLGIGMLIGDDGIALVRFDRADVAQTIGVVALVVILFQGGLETPGRSVRSVLGPAAVLALAGTAVTAAVTGSVFHWAFGVSWSTALLTASVVASTDAAAVFSILGSVGLPRRLLDTLEVESGLNDPWRCS